MVDTHADATEEATEESLMWKLIEAKLEDAHYLALAVNRAESQLTAKLTAIKKYMENIDPKLNSKYRLGRYGYKDVLYSERSDIHCLESLLLSSDRFLRLKTAGQLIKHQLSVTNNRLASMSKQLHHRCVINLANEKQLLRDIKQAEEDKRELTNIFQLEDLDSYGIGGRFPLSPISMSVNAVYSSIIQSYECVNQLKLRDKSDKARKRDLQQEMEWVNRNMIQRLETKLEVVYQMKNATQKLIDDLETHLRDESVSY